MIQSQEFQITAENRLHLCDEISEKVGEFCKSYLTASRDILRYRLTAEECLLNWLTEESVGKRLVFRAGKKLGAPCFELGYFAPPKNPYIADETLGAFGESTLRSMGLSPSFSYRSGQNVLRFSISQQEEHPLRKLILVLLSAVLVGALGLVLLPESFLQSVQTGFVTPVYDAFFRILSCVAGPMIFLSVAWGVYGIGDTATLSLVGKRMLLKYVKNDSLVALCVLILLPVFHLDFSSTAVSVSGFSGLINLLLSIIPDNPFSPFIEGNTMQVIFLAFATGIALLFLGKLTESVAHAIEQINYIIQFFMKLISKLVPFFVFLVVISLFWSGGFNVFSSAWRVIVIMLICFVCTVIGFYIYTSIHQKVSIRLLIKKCLPCFLIGLATASSAATFSTNREIAEKRLGVNESISCFGIPLGMVVNKPISVLNNIVIVFFFAWYYGVECSVSWIIMALVMSVIVSIATPPIPGGGAIAYGLLFTQLGIPAEALPVALTIDMLSDFLITASEMAILPVTLLNISSEIGMIDREILEAE